MRIKRVQGREVIDSRGLPTVEAEVWLEDDACGVAIVPSGASIGSSEAYELRDNDFERWVGRGALKAVGNINQKIAKALNGVEAHVSAVDGLLQSLDRTPNKRNLGANATLAVSLANARAIANSRNLPLYRLLAELTETSTPQLPTPMVNIISGGLHAGGNLDAQDFLVIPIGASTFRQALDWVGEVYHITKRLLTEKNLTTLLADEGGFGPSLRHHEDAFAILCEAIEDSRLKVGRDIALGVDVASSHFYRHGQYELHREGLNLDSRGIVALLDTWCADYPVISVEDGCAEEDWEGWRQLTAKLGSKVQLLGDDLFVTNSARIRKGADMRIANAVLIKPNQIGTLSDTLDAIRLCKKIGYSPVISARSGDSEDSFIADLAVGTASGQIKIGSLGRSERGAKYNRLLRLEEQVGGEFAGKEPFSLLHWQA
jgi:enolase